MPVLWLDRGKMNEVITLYVYGAGCFVGGFYIGTLMKEKR